MKKYNRNSKYKFKSVDQIIANTNNQELRKKLILRKQEKGLMVIIQDNNLQLALKRFKRKLKEDNTLRDIMQKRYYKKPSVYKRQKKQKLKLRIKYQKLNKEKQYQQQK